MTGTEAATWGIAALAVVGVVTRPFRWPEAVWAVAGAVALIVLGLIPIGAAASAAARGDDVYLFLVGMMLLSETARAYGLFDWVAATAAIHAGGSPSRLFLLVYAAGVVTTTFLSNDATAVVLTPAVYAAARRAKVEPLPLLFACAMVANAASFVLPISNPANLVLYGGSMPPLGAWFASFGFASLASILVTYAMLRWTERKALASGGGGTVERDPLGIGGKAAMAGIGATALVLLGASAFDVALGLPTAIAGTATLVGVAALTRRSPVPLLTDVSWSVLPLVAGLFVLVEALDRTGVVAQIAAALRGAASAPQLGPAAAGATLGFASNAVNNLPAGLLASLAVAQAHAPKPVVDALLIGVDLGPNLSVTGSLATILWVRAIRREGEDVGFWRFLRTGALVMPPALAAALAARMLAG